MHLELAVKDEDVVTRDDGREAYRTLLYDLIVMGQQGRKTRSVTIQLERDSVVTAPDLKKWLKEITTVEFEWDDLDVEVGNTHQGQWLKVQFKDVV